METSVPADAIHKALPGWIVLCRHHARAILDVPDKYLGGKTLTTAFKDCWAPEEAFFPTALALLGLLTETTRKSTTFAEWDTRAANHKARAHPLSWDGRFGPDLVRRIREEHGCIILRKMAHRVHLEDWKRCLDAVRHTAHETRSEQRNRADGNTPSVSKISLHFVAGDASRDSGRLKRKKLHH